VDGIVCGWIYSIEKHLDEGTIEVFAALHESGYGVRRGKAALSSGCKSHPANAPAGSNRSSYGGN